MTMTPLAILITMPSYRYFHSWVDIKAPVMRPWLTKKINCFRSSRLVYSGLQIRTRFSWDQLSKTSSFFSSKQNPLHHIGTTVFNFTVPCTGSLLYKYFEGQFQCSGSESGSNGSTYFWASRIWIY